jgi:hypothetical protein
MSAQTLSLAPTNSSVALFRAWGLAVSNAIAARGLVKTTDTGQVNWATVALPAINLTPAYEIWRFDDALQATAPVFIRLEYGTGSSTGLVAMAFSIGSGSNGAGVLTGVTLARTVLQTGSNSATTMACFVSGSTNRLLLALWAGLTSNPNYFLMLSLERTVDAAGAPTSEGVLVAWFSPFVTYQQLAWNCTTGPMTAVEQALGMLFPNVGTGASGGSTAVYPCYHTKGIYLLPGLNLLGGYELNFTPTTAVAFTYYAATRTYIPLPSIVSGSLSSRGTGGAHTLLVRYD